MYDSWTCQTVSKQRFMFLDMLHCSTVNDNLAEGAQTERGEQFAEVQVRPTLSGEKLVEQIHSKRKQQLDLLKNIYNRFKSLETFQCSTGKKKLNC